MNIISQSSKYFPQAHSVKATVLNLVAYYSCSTLNTAAILEAGRGMRHAARAMHGRLARIRIDSNSESMIEFHDVESIELSIGLWWGVVNSTQWAP